MRGALPDPHCTPGAVYPLAKRPVICRIGYSAKVRHVTALTKARVFAEYGIRHPRAGRWEIDHLVPLEAGGSNVLANLWPERAAPTPGFHEKDRLENAARDAVCDGRRALRPLQRRIAHDWTDVYGSLVGSLGDTPFQSAG